MVSMSTTQAIRIEEWQSPAFSAPIRGQIEAELEELKQRLLDPIIATIMDRALIKEILWAANEAAALAWCTICPVLVLPTLLEEKVRAALAKWEKQQHLRRQRRKNTESSFSEAVCLAVAA